MLRAKLRILSRDVLGQLRDDAIIGSEFGEPRPQIVALHPQESRGRSVAASRLARPVRWRDPLVHG